MATRPTRRGVGCLLVAGLLVVLTAFAGYSLLRGPGVTVPGQQRCVVTAGDRSVALDLEQARLTSIIVGLSVRRGLPARAASIAMATVYQESGIRNLEGGDRDSVGLFQQRPSQGWGTPQQLQDPYYASRKFYEALVKVNGWESGDINDVAQRVQRSGFPEAYRDHEADGRTLASAFTGHSEAAVTCLERAERAADPDGLRDAMEKSLGKVDHREEPGTLTLETNGGRRAWAYAHHAVAGAARHGVTNVTIGNRTWQTNGTTLPAWTEAPEPLGAGTVRVTLRS